MEWYNGCVKRECVKECVEEKGEERKEIAWTEYRYVNMICLFFNKFLENKYNPNDCKKMILIIFYIYYFY